MQSECEKAGRQSITLVAERTTKRKPRNTHIDMFHKYCEIFCLVCTLYNCYLRSTNSNYNDESDKEANGKENYNKNHEPFHQLCIIIIH
jgi:hypothetical protein